MNDRWKTEQLRDVVAYIAKGIPPAYVEAETSSTVCVLNQKCNRDHKISYQESRLHDLSKRAVPSEKYIQNGDVLINSTGTGTAGRIAQVEKVPRPTVVDGHMIILRNNRKLIPKYFGYALKAHQSEILRLDEGSTGQTELNRERLLAEILISYPKSLDAQRFIAETLSTIDDKIENNSAINHHLTSPTSANDSSPDIRRGSKESRVFARHSLSSPFAKIILMRLSTILANCMATLTGGMTTDSVIKKLDISKFFIPVVPFS